MGDAPQVDEGLTVRDDPGERGTTSPRTDAEGRRKILPGQAIGSLIVLRVIGEGGMGVVYAAYDPKLDRQVAVKLLQAEHGDPETARARLRREAQAMAKLSHPNVLPVYEVSTHEGEVVLVLELVRGPSLDRWLETERPWREVLECLLGAGRGLAAAHAAGLVHRDFKPENVLVGDDGRPRVADFGIAGLAEPGEGHAPALALPEDSPLAGDLTRAGAVVGTPAYMAPEQIAGAPLDGRVDQFAFCLVTWEALYGARPFGDTVPEHFDGLVGKTPLRSPPGTRGVPRAVQRALRRGLSLDPARRFPSMDALLEALESRPRQRVLVPVLAAAAVIAAGVGYGASTRRDVPSDPCPPPTLEDTWGASARGTMEQAFDRSSLPYAGATRRATERALDAYAERWANARVEACRDSAVRHVQSDAMLDDRMRCLEDRRLGLAAVVRALAAADDDVIPRAVSAVASLPSPDTCGRTSDLSGTTPLPEGPSERARVDALRQTLAEVYADAAVGRFAEGLDRATALEREAEQVGYAPLLAEVRYLRASLTYRAQTPLEAAPRFAQSMQSAAQAGMDDLLLRAAARRMGMLGLDPGHSAEALALRPMVEALAERTNDPRLRADVETSVALTLHMAGDVEGSVSTQRRVVAIREEREAEDRLALAWALGNLGAFLKDAAQLEEAIAILERAVAIAEEVLGADHPSLTIPLSALGSAQVLAGEYPTAEPNLRRGYTLSRENAGADHPATADTAWYLARALLGLRQTQEALTLLDASVATLRTHGGSRLAWALRTRAQARRRSGNLEGELSDLRDAEATLVAEVDSSHPELAWTRARLAEAALVAGDVGAARRWVDLALPYLDVTRRPAWALWAELQEARVRRAEGDVESARNRLSLLDRRAAEHLPGRAMVSQEIALFTLEAAPHGPDAWRDGLLGVRGRDPGWEARLRLGLATALGADDPEAATQRERARALLAAGDAEDRRAAAERYAIPYTQP